MKRLTFFLLLLGLSFSSLAQEGNSVSDDNPVAVRLEIYVVSVSGGEESFVEANTARPGQTVEYRLFAINEGEITLPAGTVVITGPIPESTRFIDNSASPSSERILTEFSIDNTNYSEPPVFIEGDADRRVAEAGEYKAVRWTLLEALEPGQEETFFYRVTVEKEE